MGIGEKKIRVAVVGAGYMAREHIRAIGGIEGMGIVGIYSRTAQRAAALASEFSIPHVCNSVAELNAATHADAVVVCVPELSMQEVSEACFQYPWTVLLEKPAGYTLAVAEAIRASAERSQAKAFVALNRRHYSSTRQALELLPAEGTRTILLQDQQDMGVALAAGQPPAVVQNWMFANSIHVIDYLRVFGRGDVTRVSNSVPFDAANPGTVASTIYLSSGDVGIYVGIWNGPGPWSVFVTSAGIRVEMRPLESLTVQKRGQRTLAGIETAGVDKDFKPGLYEQAVQLKRAIEGLGHRLPTIDDAFESMLLCSQIYTR